MYELINKNGVFHYEHLVANIYSFHDEKHNIHITVEYDETKNRFKAFSELSYTHKFVYHGRNYDRTKAGNSDIYRKALTHMSSIVRMAKQDINAQ